MPKGCQNGTKTDVKTYQKSMPKLVTKKSLKLSKFMFPRMVKSFKFIVKAMVFEGLTGCVREQKMYQNRIQMDTKIHAKMDENRSRNYVRKSNANNLENHST